MPAAFFPEAITKASTSNVGRTGLWRMPIGGRVSGRSRYADVPRAFAGRRTCCSRRKADAIRPARFRMCHVSLSPCCVPAAILQIP